MANITKEEKFYRILRGLDKVLEPVYLNMEAGEAESLHVSIAKHIEDLLASERKRCVEKIENMRGHKVRLNKELVKKLYLAEDGIAKAVVMQEYWEAFCDTAIAAIEEGK